VAAYAARAKLLLAFEGFRSFIESPELGTQPPPAHPRRDRFAPTSVLFSNIGLRAPLVKFFPNSVMELERCPQMSVNALFSFNALSPDKGLGVYTSC